MSILIVKMDNLQQLKKGNQAGFEHIYKEYSPRLYGFICSIVHSKYDAQDILQATFLKIWEKRGELDLSKSFEAYIYTIARNLCISYLRKRLYSNLLSLEGCEQSHNEVLQGVVDGDSARFIRETIEMLPTRRKEIFLLSRVSDMTYKQIAEHLGISENTVDTQMKRALAFLREKLSSEQLFFLCVLINL